MNFTHLPFRATLEQYQEQADELREAHRSGSPEAIRLVQEKQVRSAPFTREDARLTLARWYDFESWRSLSEWAKAVARDGSPVFQFECAVEAVITGDRATLKALLRENPELIRARSTHQYRATLLHYVAANGVEDYRQKSPENAVEIARTLLEAGAEVDALADVYGGRHTTMSLLVSSEPPAKAGVQAALAETLLDFGAAIEGHGEGAWVSPLMTALAFGYGETAETLVQRGAKVETLAAAAGLGRLEDATRLLPTADPEDRHRALALAAQQGHVEVVRLLLDAGEDPNRYNPEGNHSHSTPLHQAALAGREEVVRLLVERGARLDIKDTLYQGTPLDWAVYGEQRDVAEFLGGQDGGNAAL